jgi:hypothetical protein
MTEKNKKKMLRNVLAFREILAVSVNSHIDTGNDGCAYQHNQSSSLGGVF